MPIELADNRTLVERRLLVLSGRTVRMIPGVKLDWRVLGTLQTLSGREKQVLQLRALGLSYERIAGILGTKPDTVKNQAKNLRSKIFFGISGEELALLAFLSGLVTQEDFDLNKDSPFFLE